MELAAANSAARRQFRRERLGRRTREITLARSMLRNIVGSYKASTLTSDREELHAIHHEFMRFPVVRLNRGLLLAQQGKPPLAELLARQDESVRLFLLIVLAAQAASSEHAPLHGLEGVSVSPSARFMSWPGLLGYPSSLTRRASDARLHRSLDALSNHGLIYLPPTGSPRRYERFTLEESNPMGSLVAPKDSQMAVHLAVDFFVHAWNLVMTPGEIATMLMLMDARNAYGRGSGSVFIARDTRLKRYGLSDEVYVSHRELAEFGLVRMTDPVTHRRRGRMRPTAAVPLQPFQFVVVRSRFAWDAERVVGEALAQRPAAPHLNSHQG